MGDDPDPIIQKNKVENILSGRQELANYMRSKQMNLQVLPDDPQHIIESFQKVSPKMFLFFLRGSKDVPVELCSVFIFMVRPAFTEP